MTKSAPRSWLLLMLCLSPLSAAASPPPERSLVVQGQAEVRAQPERARLMLAVDAMEATVKPAEARVAESSRRLLQALERLGIAALDIQSSAVQLQPELVWNEKTRRQEVVGYRARRDIGIYLRDLDRLGAVLSAATEAGITHIQPPRFEAADPGHWEREALGAAAEVARSKAEVLATRLGMRLGPPRTIEAEAPHSVHPPMLRAMAADVVAEGGNAGAGLSLGEIPYSATVRVVFDLLPPR